MACGDGWYGGVCSSHVPLAYVSDDVEYVVTEALRSFLGKAVFMHAWLML